MIINSSTLSLEAVHAQKSFYHKEERLNVWTGDRPQQQVDSERPVSLNLSELAKEAKFKHEFFMEEAFSSRGLRQHKGDYSKLRKAGSAEHSDDVTKLTPEDRMKVKLVESLLSRIMGRRVTLTVTAPIDADKLESAREGEEKALHMMMSPKADAEPENVGWGLEYDYEETRFEGEFLQFSSRGHVKTADGREISFAAELSMKREYYEYTRVQIRAGDAVFADPLVLNFDGKGADVTDKTHRLDIDLDGSKDTISRLAPGSAFLVQDKNSDGIVNDGHELFGPESGHGFSELAMLDSDGNGWIDEADPAFSTLSLWFMGSDGDGELKSLKELGVGAIYLDAADGEFSLKPDHVETMAKIKETGVYLNENGTPGFIQELDMQLI